MLAKMGLLVAFGMAIRWTLPRFRFDQLMRLAWEGMIPCSLLVVVITAVWVFMGWQEWMFLASLATIVIVYVVHPFMPRQAEVNDRIQMIGSRFNPVDEHGDESGNAAPGMSLTD